MCTTTRSCCHTSSCSCPTSSVCCRMAQRSSRSTRVAARMHQVPGFQSSSLGLLRADINQRGFSAPTLLPSAPRVPQHLPHIRRLAGLAARSRRSAGSAAPHCRRCGTITQVALRDKGLRLARGASLAKNTGHGCAGGVRRNASEERVHFLAAMRNKALEPLWQNTSVLFQVTTHNASCHVCSFHFLHSLLCLAMQRCARV